MPVSFSVADHAAKSYSFENNYSSFTPLDVLAKACKNQYAKAGEMIQFSLPKQGEKNTGSGRDFTRQIDQIVPNSNGFVATILDAYTQDRALVIRPDDVWLAILCQFNFFVNARAEILRTNFVSHKGKKELVIDARPQSRHTLDYGHIARQMTELVEKNVVDPTLRTWATPQFTTTTENDATVGAILLMATLQQYFEYVIQAGGCGIPRVTIEGEKSDWINILGRIEKLKEYGLETTAWYHLLRPIISRFIFAFDNPTSPYNVDFWQRIAHYDAGGSGKGDWYTGWMTAFTVFDKEGRWIGHRLSKAAKSSVPCETLTPIQFWDTYGGPDMRYDLVMDGTPYHRLSAHDVPPGFAEVPVKLQDGDVGKTYDCTMVAGSVGMQVSSSGDKNPSSSGTNDTMSTLLSLGWWMFIDIKDQDKIEKRLQSLRYRY
ncbi:hypothetical protein R3P38DRAFT_2656597 [Favolaschia claudopus]|uniref:Uncharacterized protein n=1 Tax=Favolaschia claudopus TaxID=2862362 RepID=A0AAV9ZVY3_9AGAR